jgi:hypothetical protein
MQGKMFRSKELLTYMLAEATNAHIPDTPSGFRRARSNVHGGNNSKTKDIKPCIFQKQNSMAFINFLKPFTVLNK